jgi:hypothetical protein
MLDQPLHELDRVTGLRQALGTEELTHTTERPVVPPNAKPAARGRACRSLQGGGRAWRSSTSERFDSDCVRRILRPGQFTHCNGALGAPGAVRPRGNRPPELAANSACASAEADSFAQPEPLRGGARPGTRTKAKAWERAAYLLRGAGSFARHASFMVVHLVQDSGDHAGCA